MAAALNDTVHFSRAEQRKRKLLEIEREQQIEELEALKMTEEQLHLLRHSFTSVKFEFHDLDGLRWTPSALYTRQYRAGTSWHPHPVRADPQKPHPRNRGADCRFSEETIRVPARHSRPALATIKTSGQNAALYSTPCPSPLATPSANDLTFNANVHYGHRDGTRQRSPVKGLFPTRDWEVNTASENDDFQAWDSPDIVPVPQFCPPSPTPHSVGVFEDGSNYSRALRV